MSSRSTLLGVVPRPVMKAVHHDHCYFGPPGSVASTSVAWAAPSGLPDLCHLDEGKGDKSSRQGPTSLLFPLASDLDPPAALSTSIQGGKVIVVTSQGLLTSQTTGLNKDTDLSGGVAHDHGHYFSPQRSDASSGNDSPSGQANISLDLSPGHKADQQDVYLESTSSNISFPRCEYSALPAIIFAQDDEETGVIDTDIDRAVKLVDKAESKDNAKAGTKSKKGQEAGILKRSNSRQKGAQKVKPEGKPTKVVPEKKPKLTTRRKQKLKGVSDQSVPSPVNEAVAKPEEVPEPIVPIVVESKGKRQTARRRAAAAPPEKPAPSKKRKTDKQEEDEEKKKKKKDEEKQVKTAKQSKTKKETENKDKTVKTDVVVKSKETTTTTPVNQNQTVRSIGTRSRKSGPAEKTAEIPKPVLRTGRRTRSKASEPETVPEVVKEEVKPETAPPEKETDSNKAPTTRKNRGKTTIILQTKAKKSKAIEKQIKEDSKNDQSPTKGEIILTEEVPLNDIPPVTEDTSTKAEACVLPKEEKLEEVEEKKEEMQQKKPPPKNSPRKRKSSDNKSDVEEEFTIRFIPDGDITESGNHWGHAVPSDILLRIFQYVVSAEGRFPFLSRASKVCRLWYEVARHPSLWTHVDLSGTSLRKYKKSLTWLCRRRLGDACKYLSLSGWNTLTDADIQILTKYCTNLEGINLAKCSKLTAASVQNLVTRCNHLQDIDLSSAWTYAVTPKTLTFLIETMGGNLQRLCLAMNALVRPDSVVTAIMAHCPNLAHLDMSNCYFSSYLMCLPIERLQVACPKLRSLLFANSLFQVKSPVAKEQAASEGFPCLEHLDVSRSPSRVNRFRYVTDDVLQRLLKNSRELKTLDVSGCRHVTANCLKSLPTEALQSLAMSQCRAVMSPDITDTILKWRSSLTDLDLSGNSIDVALVLRLVTECERLHRLDVSGCRGLPWGARRDHVGKAALQQLAETLRQEH